MTPTPDTPTTPDAADVPAAEPQQEGRGAPAAPGPAPAPVPPAPAPLPPRPVPLPPGPSGTDSAPPVRAGRSPVARPILVGAAAVLVAAAAFGGGFAAGRSTAPEGDSLRVEVPADWRGLPGPGGAREGGELPSLPGDRGTDGGLPDLERGDRGRGDATDRDGDASAGAGEGGDVGTAG